MKNLRKQLRRLEVIYDIATPKPEPGETRKPPVLEQPASAGLSDAVRGEWVHNSAGTCFVAEKREHYHPLCGKHPLVKLLSCDQKDLAALARDATFNEVRLHQTAFVDTETTGLAGGTGTYVFLTGVGFFSGDDFCVRQYFMHSPHEEAAMLCELDGFLSGFRAVVSFNGKSFDLPLLKTRFALHRRPFALDRLPHLDLLAPARLLWKRRLPSCGLVSLEQNVLEIFRDGDVPGWMVPSLYFQYLRTGHLGPLQSIFTHNALDIYSMVCLGTAMAEIVGDPHSAGVSHGTDWYSLGRFYEDLGRVENAASAYRQSLAFAEIRSTACHSLSFFYKRQERWQEAVDIWHSLVQNGGKDLYPYEELAKYYEHEKSDYQAALRLVHEAISRLERHDLIPKCPRPVALAALYHRRMRLQHKLSGNGEFASS